MLEVKVQKNKLLLRCIKNKKKRMSREFIRHTKPINVILRDHQMAAKYQILVFLRECIFCVLTIGGRRKSKAAVKRQ